MKALFFLLTFFILIIGCSDSTVTQPNHDDNTNDYEIINTKDFGAIGDGIADDTKALNNAVAAATGKVLLIEPGKYLTSGLKISGQTVIMGYSAELIASPCTGDSCEATILVWAPLGIEGLEINCNNTSRAGIVIGNTSDIFIEGCYIYDSKKTGLTIHNSSKFIISNCRIDNCTLQGMDIIFSHEGKIINCYVNNTLHGIQWWGGDPSFSEKGVTDLVISGNTVTNIQGGGIWGAWGDRINIDNNNVKNCGDVGIDPEGSINSVVSDNTVKNCINAGISTFFASEQIEFTGNFIKQDDGYGHGFFFYATGWNEYMNVTGNIIHTYNKHCVGTDQFSLSSSLISDNVMIVDTDAAAIRILDGSIVNIINNQIQIGDTRTCIAFEGVSNSLIEGNWICTGTQLPNNIPVDEGGIHLYWRSAQYPCQNNTIKNNVIEGFYVSINDNCWGDHTSYNLIDGNRVENIFYREGDYHGIIVNNYKVNSNQLVAGTGY